MVTMKDEHHFIAIDLGAESGRAMLVRLAGDRADLQEVHRWHNRPVVMAGTRYWNLPHLFNEILDALKLCAARNLELTSIGVDAWGVDFGLLDYAGRMISLPVQYRDSRTEGIHEYSDPIMSRQEIFLRTGYEPWAIASLFQLLAMQRDHDSVLEIAETFLNFSDMLNYLLTGHAVNERSIACTSGMMNASGCWDEEIIRTFGLKRIMFGPLVEPGTVLGPLRDDIRRQTQLTDIPVIAVAGHDTASAAAAVPAVEGDNWAFLSCGTWSVLGAFLDEPICTPHCLSLGFTNEYTYGQWFLARNISGLWLVQELRRKWNTLEDPLDYDRMTNEARSDQAASYGGLIDVADPSLTAPIDMQEAIEALLAGSGQDPPKTRGQLVRCVLTSLALEYNARLETMSELTGRKFDSLYMVGGGIANDLLCQLTADACGINIHAGPTQCTAMGNALIQAAALKIIDGPQAIRSVMRESTEIADYRPQSEDQWSQKREDYAKLISRR
ncbi:MAG: rhamnulokinase family protein [Phycisphaerae bacterium]|jgi:sugar (pentulose or hexulose) kinase|nr:rhamnulokinase family protein [Phycisphaerae bacterium]